MPQIRDIMTSDIVTINETQTVKEAAALMSQYNIGAIPVLNSSNQMVGMITDRDITLRTTAQGQNAETPVSEVMTAQQIVHASPDMDVQQVADLMAQQQVRRLPVVENDQIVGVVALGDLAVQSQYANEAEQALQNISNPSRPQN
jgi:CBS domain-containing protein